MPTALGVGLQRQGAESATGGENICPSTALQAGTHRSTCRVPGASMKCREGGAFPHMALQSPVSKAQPLSQGVLMVPGVLTTGFPATCSGSGRLTTAQAVERGWADRRGLVGDSAGAVESR